MKNKVVKIKKSPSLFLADMLLEVLRANAQDLFKNEKFNFHYDGLYECVQEMLDIGEWVDIKDIYYVVEKEVEGE